MSRLKVDLISEAAQPDSVRRLIRIAAKAAFLHFGYPFDGQVDITVTDDAGIHVINREQRNIDRATDVLSFPMADFYRGVHQGNTEAECDPATGAVMLGDMIISVERAAEQARQFGHPFARECAYLTVHSMLHLLGFDHVDEGEEKRAMRIQEEQILAKLGLPRTE